MNDALCGSLLSAIGENEDLKGLGLNFGWNKISKNMFEGVYNWMKSSSKLRTLEYLAVECEKSELSRESALFISKMVEMCQILKHLTLGLSGNVIGAKGYQSILKKAEGNEQLTSVQLNMHFPDYEGDDGKELARIFGSMKQLKRLGFYLDV